MTRIACISLVVACVGVATTAWAQPPFPGAVFVNGGWVPCDHPLAQQAGVGCVGATAPPRADPPAPVLLQARTGARYTHRTAGWVLYIVGPVQRASGAVVIVAEVIQGCDVYGNRLFDDGTLLEITGYFIAADWMELPREP